MDAVKKYKKRREKRIQSRMDAEDGRWVTTENDHHVHINSEGVPDKGNPHVLKAMSGGAKAPGVRRVSEDPKKLTKSGRRSRKYTAGDISMADLRNEVKKLIDEKGIDNIKNKDVTDMKNKYGIDVSDWENAIGYWRYGAGKKKLEKEKKVSESKPDTISGYSKAEPTTSDQDFVEEGYEKSAEGRWEKSGSNKEYGYGSGDDKKIVEAVSTGDRKTIKSELDKLPNGATVDFGAIKVRKTGDNEYEELSAKGKSLGNKVKGENVAEGLAHEKKYAFGEPKVDYGYGSGDDRKENTSYEPFSYGFRIGGRKYASAEETKQVQRTVTNFMNNAKEGDVYSVGGSVGSSGGQKFKVVGRGSKLALAWLDSDGHYSHPVQMSRANVEKFISNGAKLVNGSGDDRVEGKKI